MPDTEPGAVLRDVLDQWQAGIDAHEPQRVAALFTDDGIFQGLRPYSVGPQGVHDYYDAQPHGMTVAYRVLESREISADAVLGYLRADFSYLDGRVTRVHIGVLVRQTGAGWRIAYYQASRAD
ncbi:nuclear transport factor 2 family protein [Mycobacterium sp. 1423905.2]|uniref:YybH family protein n=1 Tax=Mycobacterium sp. 1423905.2 TaxID=1856859 RepID=UPI00080007EF|nr:nuclear transport factor 2 family protein [Mycobacterium sp. 1423905.2]OBJ48449.1 hypothetical protein A9W95_04600 [Mycobacterium sp. 1423905.2]